MQPYSLIVAGIVVSLLAGRRVFTVQQLEDKLAQLGTVLIGLALMLLLDIAAIVWHVGTTPYLARGAEVDVSRLHAQLDAVREHGQRTALIGVGVLLQFAILLPSFVHTLRELKRFVMVQRLDLVAREQASGVGS